MKIRIKKYQPKNFNKIIKLFQDTVTKVNNQDYDQKQISLWSEVDYPLWRKTLIDNYTIVAWHKGQIVGFGDLADQAYIYRLFIHRKWLRAGVASKILKKLEKSNRNKDNKYITTEASITALAFFLKRGYKIVSEQSKVYKGTVFKNYLMKKQISNNRKKEGLNKSII